MQIAYCIVEVNIYFSMNKSNEEMQKSLKELSTQMHNMKRKPEDLAPQHQFLPQYAPTPSAFANFPPAQRIEYKQLAAKFAPMQSSAYNTPTASSL